MDWIKVTEVKRSLGIWDIFQMNNRLLLVMLSILGIRKKREIKDNPRFLV